MNLGLKLGKKITRLLIFFFNSSAWVALWLPLCLYPSHLFLKITLELVIIFVPAHDRKKKYRDNPPRRQPVDNKAVKARSEEPHKEKPGFCFPSDMEGSSGMKPLGPDSSDLPDICWITCWKDYNCLPRASLQRPKHNIGFILYIAHTVLPSVHHKGTVWLSETFRKQ